MEAAARPTAHRIPPSVPPGLKRRHRPRIGGAIQAPRTYYEKYPHAIYTFNVTKDAKRVTHQRLFTIVSPGFPDGMRLDAKGNIYVGALDGVQIFNPKGKLIGKILMPKETANLTFGGKDNNILFICSSNSIWAIKLNVKGAIKNRELSHL